MVWGETLGNGVRLDSGTLPRNTRTESMHTRAHACAHTRTNISSPKRKEKCEAGWCSGSTFSCLALPPHVVALPVLAELWLEAEDHHISLFSTFVSILPTILLQPLNPATSYLLSISWQIHPHTHTWPLVYACLLTPLSNLLPSFPHTSCSQAR